MSFQVELSYIYFHLLYNFFHFLWHFAEKLVRNALPDGDQQPAVGLCGRPPVHQQPQPTATVAGRGRLCNGYAATMRYCDDSMMHTTL